MRMHVYMYVYMSVHICMNYVSPKQYVVIILAFCLPYILMDGIYLCVYFVFLSHEVYGWLVYRTHKSMDALKGT